MDTPPDSFTVTPGSTIEPRRAVAHDRDQRFSVMATAACTSASVSLLTLWLWTPAPAHVNEGTGTVSVTYEQLDSTAQADDAAAGADATIVPIAQSVSAPLEAPATASGPPAGKIGDEEKAPVNDGQGASRFVITTQPEGASVTINGVGYGTTPLTIPYLPPGAKRVRVTKAGYEAAERFYSGDSGGAAPLRLTLRELPRRATR
jgi:hypothetical protein